MSLNERPYVEADFQITRWPKETVFNPSRIKKVDLIAHIVSNGFTLVSEPSPLEYTVDPVSRDPDDTSTRSVTPLPSTNRSLQLLIEDMRSKPTRSTIQSRPISGLPPSTETYTLRRISAGFSRGILNQRLCHFADTIFQNRPKRTRFGLKSAQNTSLHLN
ncbi:hypothetical protein B0H10DRAFT_2201655 [Mycena sp. CBHHK59/15]|nr:hypothetical protein B0H10DRAFT_2201655 [Mycena sp. CBHHK59/15]